MVPTYHDPARTPNSSAGQDTAAMTAAELAEAKHEHLVSCDACWAGQSCVDGARLGLTVPHPTPGGGR